MGKEFLQSVANRVIPAERKKSEVGLATAFFQDMTPVNEVSISRKYFLMRDLRDDARKMGLDLGNVVKQFMSLAEPGEYTDAITRKEAEMGFTLYWDHLKRQTSGNEAPKAWASYIEERRTEVAKRKLDYGRVLAVSSMFATGWFASSRY